jgi:hypothetical protein
MDYTLIGILVTVVGQGLYVAYKMGKLEEKLNHLEKKQDKHNNLIERMVRVEDSCTSAWKKINEVSEAQHECIFKKGVK